MGFSFFYNHLEKCLFLNFYVFKSVAFQVNPIVEKKTSLIQRSPKKILTIDYLI